MWGSNYCTIIMFPMSCGGEISDFMYFTANIMITRMGFHIAPFHSVEHLHLHVHGLPYRSPWRAAKYPVIAGHGTLTKGFSWFVEIEQAIQIVKSRKAVQILPC